MLYVICCPVLWAQISLTHISLSHLHVAHVICHLLSSFVGTNQLDTHQSVTSTCSTCYMSFVVQFCGHKSAWHTSVCHICSTCRITCTHLAVQLCGWWGWIFFFWRFLQQPSSAPVHLNTDVLFHDHIHSMHPHEPMHPWITRSQSQYC